MPLGVSISQDCERLATGVAHFPYVPGKTDARVAFRGEQGRLDTANDRLASTSRCQKEQRLRFESAKKG